MKNLNVYYFDNDLGDFDEFNPRFVMEQNRIKEILTILSLKPAYHYSKTQLIKKLKLESLEDFNKLLCMLENISAINIKEERLKLNFPFFQSRDIKVIKKIIKKELVSSLPLLTQFITDASKYVQELYPLIEPKLSLYHLLCGRVFDGTMFDYLETEGLLKQSYPQKDNRDYMIIGYADNSTCNNFNKNLFCSFNHARFGKSSLSSFGNADGERFDYFRYFKLRNINRIYGKFKLLHQNFENLSDENIVQNSLEVIKSIYSNQKSAHNIYSNMLIQTQYLTNDFKIQVPVFDNYITNINLLSEFVFNNMGNTIKACLNNITSKVLQSNVLCVNHAVDKSQICNEVWHMFFGLLNKFLIDKKIVAKPQRFKGEGKYLKCVYLD